MNPDTAELAIRRAGGPDAAAPTRRRAAAGRPPRAAAVRAALARLRADPQRMAAVRDSWRALWSSRLLVWAAGVGTVLAFGFGPARKAFNPPGVTRGFGWLGDLLAAPGRALGLGLVPRDRPLRLPPGPRPLHRRAHGVLPALPARPARDLVARAARPCSPACCSRCGAFALALYGIHRLTTLELGLAVAGGRGGPPGVLVTAFAPMAFFFSAVYSESLYLALSVGLFWSARAGPLGAGRRARRRWRRRPAAPGSCCCCRRSMLYLYGPREDRAAGPPRAARGAARLRPRYRAARRRALAARWSRPASRCSRSASRSPAATRSRRSTPRRSGSGTSRGRTWRCGTGCARPSRAPASCSPSSARTSTSRRAGQPDRRGRAQPDAARLPARRGARGRRCPAPAAARLRRLRARRARAAALLPRRAASR